MTSLAAGVASVHFSVCNSEKCLTTYTGADCGSVITLLQQQPDVVDLLINLLYASCVVEPARGAHHSRSGPTATSHAALTSLLHARSTASSASYAAIMAQLAAGLPFNPFGAGLGGVAAGAAPAVARPSAQVHQTKPKFTPFPPLPELKNNSEALVEALDLLPPVSVMATAKSEVHLQAMLDDVSPVGFRLLKWVLQAGRMNMTLIPAKNQVAGMGTTLQFQVVTTQPEKEVQFREWQRRSRGYGAGNGSFVAFHGSSIANWHSILRTGLRGGSVCNHCLQSLPAITGRTPSPPLPLPRKSWNLIRGLLFRRKEGSKSNERENLREAGAIQQCLRGAVACLLFSCFC